MSGQGQGTNSTVQAGRSPGWAQQGGGQGGMQPFAGPQGFGPRRQAIFNERQMGGPNQMGGAQMSGPTPLNGGGLMDQMGIGQSSAMPLNNQGGLQANMGGGQMSGQMPMSPQAGGSLQNLIGGRGQMRGGAMPMFNNRMMRR